MKHDWLYWLLLAAALVFLVVVAVVAYAHDARGELAPSSVTGIPVEWLFAAIATLGGLVYADVRRELSRVVRATRALEVKLAHLAGRLEAAGHLDKVQAVGDDSDG